MAKNIEIIDEDFVKIPIEKIRCNPYNDNRMSKEMFEKLKNNIIKEGFNQPILVVYKEDKDIYEIIDGEHRFKAVKEIGKQSTITAKVLTVDEATQMIMTLSYNTIRGEKDVNDTAKILNKLTKTFKVDMNVIEKSIGLSKMELKLLTSKIDKVLNKMNKKTDRRYFDRGFEGERVLKPDILFDVSFNEKYQVGQHIVASGDVRSSTTLKNLVDNKMCNLIYIDIPIKEITIADDKMLKTWLKPTLDFMYNALSADGFLLIGCNTVKKNTSQSYYDLFFINHILTFYKMTLVDTIIIVKDYDYKSFLRDGYKKIYCLAKSNQYKFNIDALSRTIPNSLVDVEYGKKREDVYPVVFNVMRESSVVVECPYSVLLPILTNEMDTVLELYMTNSKLLLSCDNCNRNYIGIASSPTTVSSVISSAVGVSDTLAKCNPMGSLIFSNKEDL